MRMTALDVQNHSFPRRLRGYDPDEVEQFRQALVEDWTALTAETDGLRRRVAELEAKLEHLAAHEQALRDAMVTAQGVSDDLRRTAEQEAQMRVGRAEIQAEKILAAAHRQTARLAQDVRELRSLRSRMAGSVRATIETHLALLEGFSRDPEDELDEPGESRLEALAGTTPDPSRELFGPPGPPEPAASTVGAPAPPQPQAPPGESAEAPERPEAAGAGPPRTPSGWSVLLDQG